MSKSMQQHEAKPIGAPKISYRQALARHFEFEGVTYTVGQCPDHIFLAFLATFPLPYKQKAALVRYQAVRMAILQELAAPCDTFARWWVLTELLHSKIEPPFLNC